MSEIREQALLWLREQRSDDGKTEDIINGLLAAVQEWRHNYETRNQDCEVLQAAVNALTVRLQEAEDEAELKRIETHHANTKRQWAERDRDEWHNLHLEGVTAYGREVARAEAAEAREAALRETLRDIATYNVEELRTWKEDNAADMCERARAALGDVQNG